MTTTALTAEAARQVAGRVVDPELRVVTIAELGILRGAQISGERVTVTITPTYSGCPAMDVIRADITRALRAAGWPEVEVVTTLDPAWSTDWITESGRHKLVESGIAPPGPVEPGAPVRLGIPRPPARDVGGPGAASGGDRAPDIAGLPCPRCGSTDTSELSRFGSTACKALWRCTRCREPFEHLKAF